MSGRGRRHQGRDNPLEFVQQWRERSRQELVTLADGRVVTQEEHLQSLDIDRRQELEQLRREAEYLMYIGGLPEEDFLLLRQQGMLGDRRNTTPEDLEARRQQLRTQTTNQPATQSATNQHTPGQPAANQHAATQQAPVTRMQLRPRQNAAQSSPREAGHSSQDSGHRRVSGSRGAAARRRSNRPASATVTNRTRNNTSDTGNDASEEASTSGTTSTSTGSRQGRGRRRRPTSATVSRSTQAGRTGARPPRPTTTSAGRRSSSQPSRGAGSVNRPRRRLTGRRRVRPREGSGASAFQQQLDMLAYQLFLRSFLEEDTMDGSDSDSSDFSDSWDEDYDSWEDFLEDELSDDESSDSWDGFLEVMGMFSPRDAEMWGDVEGEEEEAPRGLTKDEIAQLPCRKFTRQGGQQLTGEGSEDSCTICMVEYKTGNKLRRMPCAHEFHSKCVDRWLKQNGSCPVCRQQVEISVNPQTAEGQQTNQQV
ncbi:uncharacterized protein LOC144926720 [Branchiostoma floridae x Branchiostoma belcheri]